MVKANADKQVALCARCQPLMDSAAQGRMPATGLCDTCVVRALHNFRVALWGRDAMAPMCEACAGRPAVGEPGRESA